MTLDEMLALLPDNTTGQITAADLRAIVTALHERASLAGQVFAYQWTTTGPPNNGRAHADWTLAETTLSLSETTDDGQVLTFAVLDSVTVRQVVVATASGSRLYADITGNTVDQGGYRDLPVTVTEVVGPAPANNEKVTVLLLVGAGS